MSLEKIAEVGVPLSSPVFDKDGNLYVCSNYNGDILMLQDGGLTPVGNTSGQPTGAAVDEQDGALYICDVMRKAILRGEIPADGGPLVFSEVVKEYEGSALRGPNSLCFDPSGNLVFTDSGPFGDTTLNRPFGNVFSLTGSVIRTLVGSLAHPAGVCYSPRHSSFFVCEMMENRILRLSERPPGVYQVSVFHRFNGGIGPSSITCDSNGNLYVGRFDYGIDNGNGNDNTQAEGVISIISLNGNIFGEFSIPGSEVTGVVVDRENKFLYIVESSLGALYRYQITPPEEAQ